MSDRREIKYIDTEGNRRSVSTLEIAYGRHYALAEKGLKYYRFNWDMDFPKLLRKLKDTDPESAAYVENRLSELNKPTATETEFIVRRKKAIRDAFDIVFEVSQDDLLLLAPITTEGKPDDETKLAFPIAVTEEVYQFFSGELPKRRK